MYTKICNKCGIEKSIDEFHKAKKYKDGIDVRCKECKKEILKKYYSENIIKEKRKNYQKSYYKKNKEKLNDNSKKYHKNNNEKIKKNIRNYYKKRFKEDIVFKLAHDIKTNIRKSFKKNGYTKKSSTFKILGCTFEEFKLYLENKFEPWMNWENRGKYNGTFNYGWDIDHIIPISSAKNEDNIIILNHYTNLQPLCSKFNRDIKKDKNFKPIKTNF